MKIEAFYEPVTFTVSFVVYDESTKDAVVIDPVLDYAPNSASISRDSADEIIEFIKKENLNLHYVLESHAHADHLSSSQIFKKEFPNTKVAINSNITAVQEVFKGAFNDPHLKTDGSQFDKLLGDEEVVEAGSLKIKTIFTPGHTPACSTFDINGALFVGDLLFMPDMGTGRCDFPKGSVSDMYDSIKKLYDNYSDDTKIYVGHDYQPGGRELEYESTIGESKKSNIQMRDATTKEEFTDFRSKRDAQLDHPKIIYPSIQVNIRAGHLPEEEDNGTSYLKMPVGGADILK